MKLGRRQVFERVEPPSGGLAKLRAKLEAEEGRARGARWWLAGAAVAGVAVVGLLVRLGPGLIDPSDGAALSRVDALPGALEMAPALASIGLAEPADEPVSVPSIARGATAVERVPLATEDVVFYWVATRNEPSESERESVVADADR